MTPRVRAILLMLVSAQALVLTTIGCAGAIGFAAQQRSKQIAIELALGAQPRLVRWQLIRSLATLSGLALAIGLAAAMVLLRIVSSYLYGVRFIDAATVVSAIALLTIAISCAAWLPARRATSRDIMATLRDS